jgi:hypothetical protein
VGAKLKLDELSALLTFSQVCKDVDLGVENLDSLVMIYKNWLDDARVGCSFANERCY